MAADMLRLPLPEPDEGHPLDWYPEPDDDPRGVPVEAVERRVREHLTRTGELLPGVRTETSYVLPEGLSYEQWEIIGRELQRTNRAVSWWAGDWIAYGERHYGETYTQAIQATKKSEQTLMNAVFVARAFEISRRREKLSFSHHAEVAGLEPDEADVLLDQAEAQGWSRQVLRAAARAYRRRLAQARAAALPAPEPEAIPELVRVEVADARAMPLDDRVVDLVCTSPPYGISVDYPEGDIDPDDWPDFMHHWLLEARRVTKEQGRLALNVPLDTAKGGFRPTYALAVQAALDAGWIYRSTIVWHDDQTTKGGWALGSQVSADAPYHVSQVEMIALFSRGSWGPSSNNPDDITPEQFLEAGRGPWRFPGETRAFEGHPAPFPLELPRRLIRYLCRVGDTVLDPFAGSGTTLAAAVELERKAIGFDLSEAYVRSALRRVME